MSTTRSTSRTVPPRSSVRVVKQRVVGGETLPPETDFLAIEDPLEIKLCFDTGSDDASAVRMVTMRTPGHDTEMIHGFLYAEGIIQKATDILAIEFSEPKACEAPTSARVQLRPECQSAAKNRERGFALHSSCGVCGSTALSNLSLAHSLRIEDDTQIEASWIHSLPEQMNREQATFHQTGGLHAAAIFSPLGALLASREDIGRHNALDKAIGANLIAGLIPARGHVLCVSGRMSYEILQKALVARIPIIAGVGAPSSLAVSLANDFNVTLIGFVRNNSYNIYSAPHRIAE